MMIRKNIFCPQEIILIRHGQSKQNVHATQRLLFPALIQTISKNYGEKPAWLITQIIDLIRGRPSRLAWQDKNVPLTRLGKQQAIEAGKKIAQQQLWPEVILCSSFKRAKDTALLLRDSCGKSDIPIIVLDFLKEKNEGLFDGIPRTYLSRVFSKESLSFFTQGHLHYRPPQGENAQDHQERITQFLPNIFTEYTGKRIAIVAHGMTNMHIENLLLGTSLESALKNKTYIMKNASILRFCYTSKGWIKQTLE